MPNIIIKAVPQASLPISDTSGTITFTSRPNNTAGAYITNSSGVQLEVGADKVPLTSVGTALGVASLDNNTLLSVSQMPAHTGEVVSTAGSVALSLVASGVLAGTYKSVTVNSKGIVTGGTNPTTLTGFGITDAVNSSLVGAVSGIATLGADGKLTTAQIPPSLVGGMNYQGIWNAATNTPTLVNSVGTKGFYYKVSIAGNTTIDTNTNWTVGDMIAFNGTTWDKLEGGSPDVSSVNGMVGAVTVTTITGNAGTATNLATSRSISATGDITWTTSFNGSANATGVATLADSGVTAGTYGSASLIPVITTDSKGRLTAVSTQAIPQYSLPTATATVLGGIKIGNNLSIDGAGVVSSNLAYLTFTI